MLWPVVLPFQITACGIGAVILVLIAIAPILGWTRLKTLQWSLLLGGVLFIPSCGLVMKVVDQTRFGGFAFPNADAITDATCGKVVAANGERHHGLSYCHGPQGSLSH